MPCPGHSCKALRRGQLPGETVHRDVRIWAGVVAHLEFEPNTGRSADEGCGRGLVPGQVVLPVEGEGEDQIAACELNFKPDRGLGLANTSICSGVQVVLATSVINPAAATCVK